MLNQYINFTQKYKKYDAYDFIMCCFLALGIVFFKERVFYLDDAYALFNMLEGNFSLGHYRYSGVIPQLLPVLGVKLGMSIKFVALLFSFSYLLFHFLIYWIVKHKLKQKVLGIIYLACLLLSMHEAFFDAISEAKLALGFAVLYAGILQTESLDNQKKMLFTALVTLLGVFAHPIFILYFVMVQGIYWTFKKQVFWQHFVLIGIFMFAKSMFFGTSSYETGFYKSLKDLSGFSNSFLHTYMLGNMFKYYKLVLIIVYLIATHLYRKDMKQELATYLLSIAGIYILLSIVNAAGESHMMIQKTLYILSFTCLYPLVFIYDTWKNKLVLNLIIPLALFASFYTIDDSSKKYTVRLERLTEKMTALQSTGEKLLINRQQIEPSSMLGSWALPYETAILSSWKLDKPMTIFLFDKEPNRTENPTYFKHVFAPPQPTEKLNSYYFKFSADSKYQPIDSTFILN